MNLGSRLPGGSTHGAPAFDRHMKPCYHLEPVPRSCHHDATYVSRFSEFIKRFYLRFYIWSLGKPCELVIYSLFYKWGYRVTLWLTALIKVTQLVRGGVWVQAHIFLVWNPLLLTNLIKPQHLIIKRDVRGHVAPSACWGAQWVPRQCISSLSTHSCLFE